MFSMLFLYNLKKIKNLIELKLSNTLNFISITIIVTLLSFAGVPPFSGFLGKSIAIIFLFSKNQYFLLTLFTVLNLFMIYYYTINIRFMNQKLISNTIYITGFFFTFNVKFLNIIVFSNFFNLCSIFFFKEYLIISNYTTSFIYLG
jgi:NADH:ubiquinone oxidoreductase subunit 2 (subunit N)